MENKLQQYREATDMVCDMLCKHIKNIKFRYIDVSKKVIKNGLKQVEFLEDQISKYEKEPFYRIQTLKKLYFMKRMLKKVDDIIYIFEPLLNVEIVSNEVVIEYLEQNLKVKLIKESENDFVETDVLYQFLIQEVLEEGGYIC